MALCMPDCLKNHYKAIKAFSCLDRGEPGKTQWVKSRVPNGLYIDLLRSTVFNRLFANPERLLEMIPENFSNWVIIDEVQKIPQLLTRFTDK